MNREIKFRVWDNSPREGDSTKRLLYDAHVHHLWNIFLSHPEDYILMQYTGLKDVDGKDIYEGDIVKVKRCHTSSREVSKGVFTVDLHEDGEEIGQIFWSLLSQKYYVSFEHIRYDDCEDFMPAGHRYKIIGNKFENPNLIL